MWQFWIGADNKACISGYTAYYITCLDLIESLKKARAIGRLKNKLKWLKKPNILLLDEVGYETLSAEESNLFFQVINSRYECGPIILTTNKIFMGLIVVFCVAIDESNYPSITTTIRERCRRPEPV